MKTHEIDIDGMSCQHCVRAVREALGELSGISRADVQVGHASVDADEALGRDVLAGAIVNAGFTVRAS